MNAHMKPPTLYEANQAACDDLTKRGYAAISEMAKHFQKSSEMSRALGFTDTAVGKWLRNHNRPEWNSNDKANEWLFKNVSGTKQPELTAASADPTTMLMVVCDRAKLEKVQKILAMIGCEVVEI